MAHPELSLREKRAILASWASDAAAILSCPALRAPEGLKSLSPSKRSLRLFRRWMADRDIRQAASLTVCVRLLAFSPREGEYHE